MKHLIQKLDNKQHEKAVFIYVRNWLSLGFQDKITEVKVLLKLGFRDLEFLGEIRPLELSSLRWASRRLRL